MKLNRKKNLIQIIEEGWSWVALSITIVLAVLLIKGIFNV